MTGVGDIVQTLVECGQALTAGEAALSNARARAEEVQAESLSMELPGPALRATEVVHLIAELTERLQELATEAAWLAQQADALRSRVGGGGSESVPGVQQSAGHKQGLSDGHPAYLARPSRGADPTAVAEGEPELVAPRASADAQESIREQNRAGEDLARAGYRVRHLPRHPANISPDFEIEGFVFDCFTPRPDTDPEGIRVALRKKIKRGQAVRFVVNLNRSRLSADDLRQHLSRSHPSRLEEVLVVKNGMVTRAWP